MNQKELEKKRNAYESAEQEIRLIGRPVTQGLFICPFDVQGN